MIIRARAPLRLGLAGGGTDVSPYCDIYGGYVLNGAIDRYAHALIKTLNEPRVHLISTDQEREVIQYDVDNMILDGYLDLHKAVYTHMIKHHNNGEPLFIELTTFSDVPAGSGLGASSTLVVAMIRAFVELLNLPLDDYAIADLAYTIERIQCGLKGGRQDQYSATFGGFNFMEFHSDNEHILINPLRIKNWVLCELEESLVLFFTGVSRESANIISDQSENVKNRFSDAIEAMHGIKHEALMMKKCLLRGDFEGFVETMRSGWENKKLSASTVSNPYIDEIYDSTIKSGALAGKVSGAGGGGFMLFFVPPEKRMQVTRNLNSFKGQVSNCHFTKHGAQAWRIP